MNDPLDSAIPVGSGPGTTVPPPAAPAPAAVSTPRGSDKIWAILSHLSGFISLFILLPLVVYLAMRHESAYAADNAKEALNFHLSLVLYGLGCALLAATIIAAPLAVVIGGCLAIGYIILSIIAAIRAYEGSVYQYPLTIRLVK